MELHFKIIGYSLMALALLHVFFPKYFNWKNELKPLSLMNKQMMYYHMFFIALTVFLIGLLCVTEYQELMTSPLGKKITLGLAIFWTFRLIVQFFGYSSQLWKGKTFETSIHIIFSIFWIYMCVIFWINFIY